MAESFHGDQGQPLWRAAPDPHESSAQVRNEELGMRNEGGGFAANIYRAMPESGM